MPSLDGMLRGSEAPRRQGGFKTRSAWPAGTPVHAPFLILPKGPKQGWTEKAGPLDWDASLLI